MRYVRKPCFVVLRKFRSATRLPISTLALTGLVWWLLWPARLAVLFFTLRRLAPLYGRDNGVNAAVPIASPDDIFRAQHFGRAMTLAAKYSPAAANCYPQALVARLLLRAARLPHGLFFGLKRDKQSDMMEAHAWVMVGPIAVCGGSSFETYTVVRCFITNRRDLAG